MKKLNALSILLILLSSYLVVAHGSIVNINDYAENIGVYLLTFQNSFMGALSFISLGVFSQGGIPAFTQFLFMIMLFIIIYEIDSFFINKFRFAISAIITILAFSTINLQQIQTILYNYESMGITITVILPILILFAFTLRIYARAYYGESRQGPFYAEIFNLIFLVFFGIFFIKYSKSEDGIIAVMRYISGWVLIALGIGQTILYKILIKIFHNWKGDDESKRRKKIKRDALEEIKNREAEEYFS